MNCKRCDGVGKSENLHGKIGECTYCGGEGTYPRVDVDQIMSLIVATRGKNKGSLRASMVSPMGLGVLVNRAYYVWRMVRFHGGADMTMPIIASMCVRYDPYKEQLDQLADALAIRFFGSNLSAVACWSRALLA